MIYLLIIVWQDGSANAYEGNGEQTRNSIRMAGLDILHPQQGVTYHFFVKHRNKWLPYRRNQIPNELG